jgi:hypothetical protein
MNVPVVYMARDVMILMRATSISRAIGRWALKIETFLGPEMATSKVSAILGPKSLDFQEPPLPTA